MKQLGNRVRALREHKQWTQQDLARESGLKRPHINLIENSKRIPGADSLAKLAKALDTSSDYLLGISDLSGPPPSPSTLSRVERLLLNEEFAKFAKYWEQLGQYPDAPYIYQTFVDSAKHMLKHRGDPPET